MSAGRRASKRLTDMGRVALAPVTAAQRTREVTNALLLPVAVLIGVAGMFALLGCGVLASIPHERWPSGLNPEQLPVYLTTSLIAASLLGWGCMQSGLGRMREAIGWTVGGWLLVLLPLVCAVLVLLASKEVISSLEQWPLAPWSGRLLRWYPPTLMVIALGVYLWVQWGKAKKGEDRLVRRAGATVLVLPYVALISVLVFGVDSPLLNDSLSEVIEWLGGSAVVVQLVLAYFISPASTSG
ncbi:MAG TPA: hypothetical protein DEA08_29060 [Planctomycetes bacterium]|nr:hypothetical protein [Planctomycetota bacterium]